MNPKEKKQSINSDDLVKDFDKKINSKIDTEVTRLRKYIAVYSGGGSVAEQFADGGTMNGNLIVNGDITANNISANTSDLDEIRTNRVSFNTTTVLPVSAGQLTWDDADGTLSLGLKGGNVSLQLGQEEIIRIVNKTNTNLLESEYKVVRVRSRAEGGAQGQRLAVVLAKGDNEIDSATTLGVVTENIINNEEGFITISGLVRNINTTGSLQGETWLDGDMLYLSPTVLGGLTKVKPTAPQHTVIMGYVVYAHQNQGKIFVKVDNGYELDELHNVRINGVKNHDVLSYNSSLSSWVNTSSLTLSSLSASVIYTNRLEALSANITVIDIKQYELSGFTVSGDATVQGSISASGNLSAANIYASNIGTCANLNYTQSDTAPPNPKAGDQWLLTLTGQKFEFYDGFWVDITGGGVSQGTIQTALSAGDYTMGGAIKFTSNTRPTSSGTGTPAETSLITRADGDSRYGSIIKAICSSQTDNTALTNVDITGMTGIALKANTFYRVELWGTVTCTATGGYRIDMVSDVAFPYPTASDGSFMCVPVGAQISSANQATWTSSTNLALNYRTVVATAAPFSSAGYFRTPSSAPTVKLVIKQNAGPNGTTSILPGTIIIFTEIS